MGRAGGAGGGGGGSGTSPVGIGSGTSEEAAAPTWGVAVAGHAGEVACERVGGVVAVVAGPARECSAYQQDGDSSGRPRVAAGPR